MDVVANYANNALLLKNILPTVACIFSNINLNSRSYDGYKVIRANLSDKAAYDLVNKLYIKDSLDFFVAPSRKNPTDFMVCPEQVNNVQTIFNYLNVPYKVIQNNLQRTIDVERKVIVESRKANPKMTWITYHRLSTIQKWMDSLVKDYPNLVRVDDYGASYENRRLKVLVINTNIKKHETLRKPGIWIDGGIHAREWISPAVATYIANELIQISVRRDNTNDYNLLDSFEWYIMPNLNPDGYEYTHSVDRMWRKTRSVYSNNCVKRQFATKFDCMGVDPNRNWDYHWAEKGSSSNPCSETYHGVFAASEPEVSLTQEYIYNRKDIFETGLYLSLHSYSQMFLLPWGYDNVPLEDIDDLMNVAKKAADALYSKHGTKYKVGPTPELLYPAAGGSDDWAKGVAGIKFAYSMELRDTGRYGFLLPADEIIPTGEETLAAVKSMAEDILLYNRRINAKKSIEIILPLSTENSTIIY